MIKITMLWENPIFLWYSMVIFNSYGYVCLPEGIPWPETLKPGLLLDHIVIDSGASCLGKV
jgi:hypothetical protein